MNSPSNQTETQLKIKKIKENCSEYPYNIQVENEKMYCPFCIFPIRQHPVVCLIYILSFDLLTFTTLFITYVVFGGKTENKKAKLGCALMGIYLLLMIFYMIYLRFWKIVLYKISPNFQVIYIEKFIKFWIWQRYPFYIINAIFGIVSLPAIISDLLGAYKIRNKIEPYYFRNRIQKYKERESFDTEIIAYYLSFAVSLNGVFWYFYGVILGKISSYALEKMKRDEEIFNLENQIRIEETGDDKKLEINNHGY